jgi:hypothetical protein
MLQMMVAFLQHSPLESPSSPRSVHGDAHCNRGIYLVDFRTAAETYHCCWQLCDAEVCVGIASQDQKFIMSDACFFAEDPWVRYSVLFAVKLIVSIHHQRMFWPVFPVFPTLAAYILGNRDADHLSYHTRRTGAPFATVGAGPASTIDVHLQNLMIPILNACISAFHAPLSLSISPYDEFRWVQELQD